MELNQRESEYLVKYLKEVHGTYFLFTTQGGIKMKKLGFLGLAHFMITAGLHESKTFFEEEERKGKFVKFKYTGYAPKKQGQQKFTYPDGFECHALNKKNADKKYNRWKKGGKA